MEADKIESEGNYAVRLFQLCTAVYTIIQCENLCVGSTGGKLKSTPLAFFNSSRGSEIFAGGSTPNPPSNTALHTGTVITSI